MKIAHLNIRSLKNMAHYIQLKNLIAESNFDIFTISKTWLNELVRDSEIAVPGYVLYRLDTLGKIGSDVCAFVKEFYKGQIGQMDKLSSISNAGFHQSWLSVQIQKHIICTFIYILYYLHFFYLFWTPPDCIFDCFDEEFSRSFISASTLKKNIYIFGDLNCNVINSSDSGSQALSDFCLSFSREQLINQPTRITELSITLIDVVSVTKQKHS